MALPYLLAVGELENEHMNKSRNDLYLLPVQMVRCFVTPRKVNSHGCEVQGIINPTSIAATYLTDGYNQYSVKIIHISCDASMAVHAVVSKLQFSSVLSNSYN